MATSTGEPPRSAAPTTAGPRTLPTALRRAAQRGIGGLRFHLEDGIRRLDADELFERARTGAGALAELGTGPGDAVGVLGPNRPEWAVAAFAVWERGGAVVPLPFSPLQERSVAVRQLTALTRTTGCRVTLAAPDLLAELPIDGARSWELPTRAPVDGALPAASDPAVIQPTSGTTGAPKAAVLSHASVTAAARISADGLGLAPGRDRLCAWLPLFHDHGLFGFLVRPLVIGIESHILPVGRFVRDPSVWFATITETGATMTGGPPSAWSVALARRRDDVQVDLSSLRLAILAAEMIDPATVDALLAAAPALRLEPGAVAAAYGLAEAVLSVSATPPGTGIRVESVDPEELAATGRATAVEGPGGRRIVSCGRPYRDLDVAVAGTDGLLPERHVGRILLRGPTLANGYAGRPRQDLFTAEGWARTGDLGYVADGELFVTGRDKEVIIAMGRNFAPDDLEWAAGRVRGVRTGRCVAFAAPGPGDGHVVVFVEPRRGADPTDLAPRVRGAVARATALTPTEVRVVPRGTVEKTTSGKLRRTAMRDAYAAGGLEYL